MNKHSTILVAGALLLGGFAVQAAPGADATAQVDPQADASATITATPPRDSNDTPGCLRYTGSRIVASENRKNDRQAAAGAPVKKPVCNGSAGRSYSREDLDRTGRGDLMGALQALDPSVGRGGIGMGRSGN